MEAEGTASADKERLDLLRSPAKKTTPPLLFPWRSSDTPSLIPRVKERIKISAEKGSNYESHAWSIATVTGWQYLDIPFYSVLSNGWKTDLADSFAWAFVQGVLAVLSNTYDGMLLLGQE